MGHGPQRKVDPPDRPRPQVPPELRAQANPRVGQLGQQRRHRQPPEPAPSAVPDGGDDDGAQEARGARGVVAGSEGLDEGLREAGADEAADLLVRRRWRKRKGNGGGEVEVEERPTFLTRFLLLHLLASSSSLLALSPPPPAKTLP